jgi:hypothetical protein
MGPAVLITLGLLFLIANLSDYPVRRTWPILLIVMGAVRLLRYAVPGSGHVNPGQYWAPVPPQSGFAQTGAQSATQAQAPLTAPSIAAPPAPVAGALSDGNQGDRNHGNGNPDDENRQNDEVHNG